MNMEIPFLYELIEAKENLLKEKEKYKREAERKAMENSNSGKARTITNMKR